MKRWGIVLLGICIVVSSMFYTKWQQANANIDSFKLTAEAFQTTDERIQFSPEQMKITNRTIEMKVRFDVDQKLKDLGFSYRSMPRFTLQINPSSEVERGTPEGIRSEEVEKRSDEKGDYLMVQFPNDERVSISEKDSLRLFLSYPGGMDMKVNESFEVNLYEREEIDLKGIGTYEVFLRTVEKQDGDYVLDIKGHTYSDIENAFSVQDRFYATGEENKWSTKGGHGSGSYDGGSRLHYFEGEYRVDEGFVNADKYHVEFTYINLTINSSAIEQEYTDIKMEKIIREEK